MQRFLASACLVLALVPIGSAQSARIGRNGTDSNSTAIGGVFLSGTVVIDGGDVLTELAEIQTVCRGQRRTETRTDSHGSFFFQFGGSGPASDAGFGADTPSLEQRSGTLAVRSPQDCELQATLAGFTSDIVQLGGRITGDESHYLGRIVLHRLAFVEGFTISATTAQAPAAAKKALEKSREQQKKGKWDEAQKLLEKAVALDSKFAVAWYELGRVQLQKNDPVAAKHAFQQSVVADPKYINPYRGLVQLAQARTKLAGTDATPARNCSRSNPVSFPDVMVFQRDQSLQPGQPRRLRKKRAPWIANRRRPSRAQTRVPARSGSAGEARL